MADNGAEGMSKSAKKRAAKKARDEAFAESNPAPPPPPPAPKAKGKAAPAPAAAAPEPKAKAKGKAKAAPEPAPQPKAEPKAKGKAKAKAEPEPVAPPPPPPAAKAKGKAKAKAKAAPVEEEPVPEKKNDELINYVIDDGTGGDWEVCTGMSKKAERAKKKAEEAKKMADIPVNQKRVPGAEWADEPKGAKGAGPSQAAAADVKRILAMKAAGEEEKPAGPALTSASITVPENRIGVVIGPKGANIQMLQEKTKTKIDTSGGIFTITGSADDVALAESAINDLIAKGYCNLMYEGFTENIISVHPSAFPDLIGKEGCIVRAIKDKLKVEINFQDVPKGSAPSKKGKVTLAGKTEDVEQAKQVINDIIMFQHHEITHPGMVHETVDVEPWAYRYIIGKAGSELKHIQHNWKVKVSIPRDNSAFENVLIIGTPDSVTRAKAYIEKLLWNAENNAKGRDRQDASAADPWGEEEEEEPWMKQYMYKR